jgi:hypothetical protein
VPDILEAGILIKSCAEYYPVCDYSEDFFAAWTANVGDELENMFKDVF